MSDKRIFFTRHAQAEHNVAEDYSILDAPLTKLGREQSANLHKETERGFQQNADLLVSSPLRRPMSTFIIGYAPLRERLEKEGKPVILLPELQEVNDFPCDTGSDTTKLEADPEFANLDFSAVAPASPPAHWGPQPSSLACTAVWTSKQGLFSPDNVLERAKWVRRWLRDREEQRIVVVAHGDILRAITDGYRSATPWANAEVREYTFKAKDDEDAVVVPVKEVAKEGEEEPTTTDVQEGRA